jgi:small subunit ribosomal protein S5
MKRDGMMHACARRHRLQQLVDGKVRGPPIPAGSPAEARHEAEVERYMAGFKMQVIDVNRSNKGTRSGGIATFSAMVVVGNFMVIP